MKSASILPRLIITNSQRALAVNVTHLQRFAEVALQHAWRTMPQRRQKLKAIQEINVILVSDRRIADLHKRFMNIAGSTDVITFQHGEIFISTETAVRQAKDFASTPADEIQLYIVHGILHLLGFDDTDEKAAKLMREKQRRVVDAASKLLARPDAAGATRLK